MAPLTSRSRRKSACVAKVARLTAGVLFLALSATVCKAQTASATQAAQIPPMARADQARETSILPRAALAARYFGGDASWYAANIPFFECSDPQITEVYYYRWKVYKSHLRDLGSRGWLVTEFLDDVGWSLKPYESLNDATGFHIHEGRWLRDPHYVNDYVDFMYHGGNDRHFSEAIAAAAYDRYLADGDRAFAVKNLAEMKRIYRQWDDHYVADKGLYFIEPLLDATEYTIASIDASGGKDGFGGGDAFRPTINSFMFANALAISHLSAMAGDSESAQEYAEKAARLREHVQQDLWNESFVHFIDRYKVNNAFVHYWNFTRGRELAGYTPWYFELPDQTVKYVSSWSHLRNPAELGGAYGLRTVEPTYEYYMRQYRYAREDGIDKRECQWNGPAWPFQTTLALGGLANLLNDYPAQSVIGRDEYVRLLAQYARQHYEDSADGAPDIQEDYDANTGHVIVGLHRSHHYNHSGYDDLVITGLAGLRPRADDTLEVNPLIPTDPKAAHGIGYLCLENVPYHGRLVTILYDRDGSRYHKGAGLSIWADGQRLAKASALERKLVALPKPAKPTPAYTPAAANLAVSLRHVGFPMPAASANNDAGNVYQAVDGRVWFYPNVRNFWTNAGSKAAQDWFSVDLGQPQTINAVKLYFYADGQKFKAPSRVTLQSWTGTDWSDVPGARGSAPARPVENGETTVTFAPVQTSRLRVVFDNPANAAVALVEMKAYATETVAPKPLRDPSGAAGMPAALDSLTGKNTRMGTFNGVAWRDAFDGGFFAFDLKAAPTVPNPNALVVTYWGGDANNRRFDILVNDVKVGEQTLENDRPGEFFSVAYPIPPAAMPHDRNKAKFTVRFQARPGAVAGGVFGVRLARQ